MSQQAKTKGVSPLKVGKLDTLAGIRTEMARLYRLAVADKIETDRCTKLIYCLKEIRCCIESGLIEDVQARLAELSARVEMSRGR